MTVLGAWHRLVRSRAVVLAVVVVAVAAVLAASDRLGGITTFITGVTAVAVLGLALGRVLFWSSPAVGKLYLKSDDNPLEEISEIVARLRRLSPRHGRPQRLADTMLATWCVLLGAQAAYLMFRTGARPRLSPIGDWAVRTWQDWWFLGVALAVLCVTALGLPRRSVQRPQPPESPEPPELTPTRLDRLLSRLPTR